MDFLEAFKKGVEEIAHSNDLEKENKELKQKLAEVTEKYNACQEARKLEIEFNQQDKAKIKQQLQEEKNRNKKLNHEAQKYYEDAYCNGFQNKKAIEELEKLKHDIWTNQQDDGWLDEKVDIYELIEMIDQQIKSLKGEK